MIVQECRKKKITTNFRPPC